MPESEMSKDSPETVSDVTQTAPVSPPSISRGGSYGPPQISAAGPKPPIAAPTMNIAKNDHASDYVQHGPESRNPYERIVAKLGTNAADSLPIISINAFGSKPPHSGLSPLVQSGAITQNNKTMHASLPYEFVVGAGQIAAELGGPNSLVTSRVTVWSQDSVPNAPKPPSTKLKTGKGGISGGVIPVDLDTTTNEGPGGKLMALPQNPNDRPSPDDKEMTTTQWAKPLEQILLGMKKTPPDFIMSAQSTDDKIKEQGYIEFKMNCTDSEAINNVTYRMDLSQQDRGANSKDPVSPTKIKETGVDQPSWWNETKFGGFNQQSHKGFHVDYKKADNEEFKPYEVYARIAEDGRKLPITGDQDLFAIPRSEIYDLKELATDVIDTHSADGTEKLAKGLREVHSAIAIQDFEEGKISMDQVTERISNFEDFIDNSHSYIEAMGTVTPYEAYFGIQLNNRVAQLKELYKDNPEELKELAEQVSVDLSMGMKNEKLAGKDIDFNPAWFKENPAEFSQRVEANMEKGFHVSPKILELQMDYLEKTQAATVSPTDESVLTNMKENIAELAKEHEDWSIYAKVEGPPPPTLPGDKPPPGPHYTMVPVNEKNPVEPDKIIDLLIRTKNNEGSGLIKVTDKGITSSASGDKGVNHIREFEDKVAANTAPSLQR